jgi:hypothetical protein
MMTSYIHVTLKCRWIYLKRTKKYVGVNVHWITLLHIPQDSLNLSYRRENKNYK